MRVPHVGGLSDSTTMVPRTEPVIQERHFARVRPSYCDREARMKRSVQFEVEGRLPFQLKRWPLVQARHRLSTRRLVIMPPAREVPGTTPPLPR